MQRQLYILHRFSISTPSKILLRDILIKKNFQTFLKNIFFSTNLLSGDDDSRSVSDSLFNGISTIVDYLIPKLQLIEQHWYYLTHSCGNKGVYVFPKGICPKVNVIARLELELISRQQSSSLVIKPWRLPGQV